MVQILITSLIVAGATGYSAWALMPQAWRQGLARRLGRAPAAAAGCGACGDCPATPAAQPRAQVIQIHRRSAAAAQAAAARPDAS